MKRRELKAAAMAVGVMTAIAGLMCVSVCASDNGEVYTLNFSTTGSQGQVNIDAVDECLDKIEERTNNGIKFSRTYSGTLGGEHDLGVMCMDGDLDMILIGANSLADWDQSYLTLSCPFLFENYEHYDAVLANEEFQKKIKEKGDALGVETLMTGCEGFAGIINAKHEVRSAEDLKGLKIRVQDSDALITMGNAMGYTATPLAASEQYMSISQGIIDGADHSLGAHVSWKLYEVAPYFTETNHRCSTTFMIMNADSMNNLPEEYQEVIRDTCEEYQSVVADALRKDAEKAETVAKDNGVSIVTNDEIDRDSFTNALKDIIDDYASKDTDLYDIIKSCVN